VLTCVVTYVQSVRKVHVFAGVKAAYINEGHNSMPIERLHLKHSGVNRNKSTKLLEQSAQHIPLCAFGAERMS